MREIKKIQKEFGCEDLIRANTTKYIKGDRTFNFAAYQGEIAINISRSHIHELGKEGPKTDPRHGFKTVNIAAS